MDKLNFLKKDKNRKCLLSVCILPDSSMNEVVGIYGIPERLKVKIRAVPENGKANDMLIIYLSEIFQIKKGKIEILRGHTNKRKDLIVDADYEYLYLQISECFKNLEFK